MKKGMAENPYRTDFHLGSLNILLLLVLFSVTFSNKYENFGFFDIFRAVFFESTMRCSLSLFKFSLVSIHSYEHALVSKKGTLFSFESKPLPIMVHTFQELVVQIGYKPLLELNCPPLVSLASE